MTTEEKSKVNVSSVGKEETPNNSDKLLRGLELLSEYYTIGLDKQPLQQDLRSFEKEAIEVYMKWKSLKTPKECLQEFLNDIRFVDQIIDSFKKRPNKLLQILLEIQNKYHWLPKPLLKWISQRLQIPMIKILNIATFYKVFSLNPKGKYIVRVCLGTACHVRGGQEILAQCERVLGIKSGESTKDMKFTLESVNCLGCCALGPVLVVNDEYHGQLKTSKIKPIFEKYK